MIDIATCMKVAAGAGAAAALLIGVSACGSTSPSGGGSQATVAPAAGDIADSARYLTYRGQGYTIKYVEGWGLQIGPGAGVTIADKDSSERVRVATIAPGTATAFIARDIGQLERQAARFHLIVRRHTVLPAGDALYLQYRTLSPPDPVTGKRVPVVVDRYYVPHGNKVAIVTLATPIGVDNVDAFRLEARSFTWA